MKQKKTFTIMILSFMLVTFHSFLSVQPVSADSDNTINELISAEESLIETKITFNLKEINQQGAISETFVDSEGNRNEIEISVDNGESGTSLEYSYGILALQNNTYTIKHTKNNSYIASFKIDVNSNAIAKVYNKNINLVKGNLGENSLEKKSSEKATLTFEQKFATYVVTNSITCNLSGGNISVKVTP